jgi:tripartite-type tricarboxylate transporter receptor subunit TctC
MLKITRRIAVFALAVAAATAVAHPAAAQSSYPDHPVRIILPFGAGGVADVTARLVAQKLSEKLGQNFVIENTPAESRRPTRR